MRKVGICYYHEKRMSCEEKGVQTLCTECDLPPLKKGQGIMIIPLRMHPNICPACKDFPGSKEEDKRRKDCPIFHPKQE